MIIKELLVKFGLDVERKDFQKADTAIKNVKTSATKMNRAIQQGSISSVASIDRLKGAFMGLGTFIAGGAVVLGMTKIIGLASDASETVNVLDAAFGENKKNVIDWSKTTSKEVGRSEFALQKMASQIGAIAQPMIGSRKAAAEMSKDLAKLAVDLGSFFNTTDDEALIALRSGLLGEAEPMRRFGVAISVANLELFRQQQGITKSIKNMTQAEKVTLRYNFIMHQTKNAQGDAEKTSKGWANALKRLQGQFTTIATKAGQKFLPTLEGLIAKVIVVTDKFGDWIENTTALNVILGVVIGTLALFGFAMGVYALATLGSLAADLVLATKAILTFSNGIFFAQLKLFAIGIAIIALIVLVALLADDLYVFFKGGNSLLGQLLDKWTDWINVLKTAGIDPDSHWLTQLLQSLALDFDQWTKDWLETQDFWLESSRSVFAELKMFLEDFFEGPISTWEGALNTFFSWLAAKLKSLPVIGYAWKAADFLGKKTADFMGDIAEKFIMANPGGGNRRDDRLFTANDFLQGAQQIEPSLATVKTAGLGNVNSSNIANKKTNNVQTNINITQQPGQDANEVAMAVENKMKEVLRTEMSDAHAATTPQVSQ